MCLIWIKTYISGNHSNFVLQKPQSGATSFSVVPNGNSFLEPKTVTLENGNMVETQDKNIIIEGGLGSVDVYDQWVAPTISGSRPRPRYEVVHLVI